MFPIRCPDCGLMNHRDDLAFPRCGHCHVDLVRCPSCRHGEESACRNPRAHALYSPDGEAAKHCPEFRSRHEVRGPHLTAWLPAPLWIALVLLIVFSGLVVASWFIDPSGVYFRGSPLRVETLVPEEAAIDRPFMVTMRIANPLNKPSSRVYIAIEEEFLASVEWQTPYPQPVRVSQYHGKMLLLEYGPLPPGGQYVLQLPFIARRGGVAPFNASIYAPARQLRHNILAPIRIVQGV